MRTEVTSPNKQVFNRVIRGKKEARKPKPMWKDGYCPGCGERYKPILERFIIMGRKLSFG